MVLEENTWIVVRVSEGKCDIMDRFDLMEGIFEYNSIPNFDLLLCPTSKVQCCCGREYTIHYLLP